MIPIQATATGFSGQAATLFSAYDPEAKVLAVAVASEYRIDRRDRCIIITNDRGIQRDTLFTQEHLQDSINAYYDLRGGIASDGASARLTFGDKAARANPDNSIERDGVDMNGFRYRVSETITSLQAAALMTCWYVRYRADTASNVFAMAGALKSMYERMNGGEIITF